MGMDIYGKHVAVIKFSKDRGCFLLVPEKWLRNFPDELPVFKILYGENKEKIIYMTCGKDASVREDSLNEVCMNCKFAEKLGIKEGEWIDIIPIITSVPKAKKVVLEPLTSDDWEIMALNATFIELNLMNQIRTVCVNQVFPIWVENLLLWTKVVMCEPDHSPVVLSEHTEVNIVPKDRFGSSEQRDFDSPKHANKASYLQFQNLRINPEWEPSDESSDNDEVDGKLLNKNYENPSIVSSYLGFLPLLFSHRTEQKSFNDFDFQEDSSEFYRFNFDCVLRVLPYSNTGSSLPRVVQATTVFISASTYVISCGDKEIPPCFVAVLQKYHLPMKKIVRKGANDTITNNAKDSSQSDNSLIKNEAKVLKNTDSNESQKLFESVFVTVMVMKSAEDDEFNLPLSLFTYKNAIVVPKELKRALNLEVTSLVNLKSADKKPLSLFRITLNPVIQLDKWITQKTVQKQFSQWAFGENRKRNSYVISDGTLVKLNINGKKHDFFASVEQKDFSSKNSNPSSPYNSLDYDKCRNVKKETEYGLLSYKFLKRTSVKIGLPMCMSLTADRPYLTKDKGLYQDINALKLDDLGGIRELSAKAVEDIEFWLKLRPLSYISNHSSTYCGCILVCGPKGVGKSSFANAICKKFVMSPYYVFVRTVQCLPLKGKRVEMIAKKWDDIVLEAIYSQPSLILFEDLDYIASSPVSHEQENGPDGVYFASISQAFVHMMNKIIESENKVAVIVTSQSLHSLHPSLVNTRGRHVFQSIIEVNPPNGVEREEILHAMVCHKTYISQHTMESVKFSDIAAKTEGYVAQDLGILVDRATHAAWVRLASSSKCDRIKLKQEDFEIALKSFVPQSLRGISLEMQDHRTWNDVGGLKQVKKVIQQIIMWPTKYKQLYQNYSLKPQTNILLYGAPGTGKTLLAGVVANECGLNFISIKGPELLSKYIGASEQAVRDLFKRATTARPCILFFDEFDSIAPRRGHDSTGVTDRVVNQLLTQLDGVESLEGVHVLAATSRPELIDPALLRPGRLDKCLLCPLPDEEERKEILECLSSKQPLSNDISFDFIATLTEHFSGADLQALLYTAHIEALHDIQYNSTRRYSTSSEDVEYSIASNKLLYVPSLEEGLKTPSYEDGQKIVQDVSLIQDKYFGKREQCSSPLRSLSVSITQRHLLKVASEMKPSVSAGERLRYNMIFKNFQNALSGEPPTLNDNLKRVTLA